MKLHLVNGVNNMVVRYKELPWKYVEVDDFLPTDVFNSLLKYCKDLGVDTPVERTLTVDIEDKSLRNSINEVANELFNSTYKELDTEGKIRYKHNIHFHLQFREPHHNYPLHTDISGKLYTIVLYIYPEVADGTPLYNSNKDYHSTIEWAQNRAMAFCPVQTKGSETFHAVTNNSDANRAALVINYMK